LAEVIGIRLDTSMASVTSPLPLPPHSHLAACHEPQTEPTSAGEARLVCISKKFPEE